MAQEEKTTTSSMKAGSEEKKDDSNNSEVQQVETSGGPPLKQEQQQQQEEEEEEEENAVAKAAKNIVGAARSKIYDMAIVHVTAPWYAAMLEELDEGAIVLDVGIGTATALVQHRQILTRKNIRLVGIDYDEGYIEAAKVNIQDASIENCIRVYNQDVYKMNDMKGKLILPHGSAGGFECHQNEIKFDAILFSGTFALVRDRVACMRLLLKSWVKPNCKIMLASAYQRTTPPMARLFKWSLKYLTTVDHGQLITEGEAKELLEHILPKECGLKVISHEIIPNSINNALEAAYLTILEQQK